MRAVWQPLQVLLTDEGLNGLHVHVINETAQPRTVRLTLRCLRDGEVVAAQAQQVLTLHPSESCRIAAAAMLDGSSISPTPTDSGRPPTTWCWPRCMPMTTAPARR
ncbi:protein of unknown function (plasmid) [Cupriavidus taiwanensis]|uniref:Uncharacterized protein n=1 Tax=Cupriavidus taiwanensis TaxID=164546 RepID=A0A9Q7UYX8_9BURK|nr:protein of unknown function [Cupriavidus taiwanensis]